MPLRVTVELVRADPEQPAETLAEMVIANVAGSPEVADYMAAPTYDLRNERRQPALVRGHRRLDEPVWSLVAKALKSLGYGEG